MTLPDYMMAITSDPALADEMPQPQGVSFDRAFNKARLQRGEGAIDLGRLADTAGFSRHTHRLNRGGDVIKKAGETDHIIPREYGQFAEALNRIAAYEARHSPLFPYKTALLTLRQGRLSKGSNQVSLGWHRDFSGNVERKKMMVDHAYIISDACPTIVQQRPLRDAFNQLNSEDVTGPVQGLSRQLAPYMVTMMTSYCLHASPLVDRDGVRTFLRVIYEGLFEDEVEALPDGLKRHCRPG